jgi:lipopolysaccharide export system protein LptA
MAWLARPGLSIAIGLIAVLAHVSPVSGAGIADHDSAQPIDIEADRLEVEQNNEMATFLGNVDVKQGVMTLKSDTLKVFYSVGDNDAGAGQAIRRIEAEGNVFITSPEETAQGDRGVYDLLGRRIELFGNVVLTQGENVVRGSKLDIDLETSVATVTAGEDQQGGRVKALFVPANN